jgi:hypothetical protein
MKALILLVSLSFSLFASIGKIVVMKGKVAIERDSTIIDAYNGIVINNKDTIITKKSKAQIMFKDETVIRVGTNTHFKIEDYLFDNTKKSKAKFKVKRGFFNAITGKIGKVARNNFKLKTRTATCGIRGTNFSGFIPPVRTSNLAAEPEQIFCTSGQIGISIGDNTVLVNAGEITTVANGLIATPRELKAGEIKSIEKASQKTDDEQEDDTQKSKQKDKSKSKQESKKSAKKESTKSVKQQKAQESKKAEPKNTPTSKNRPKPQAPSNTPPKATPPADTPDNTPPPQEGPPVDISSITEDQNQQNNIKVVDSTGTTTTPTDTIISYAGGNSPFWRLGSGSRKVYTYSGTFTATSKDANNAVGNISSDKFVFKVDFGNQLLGGYTHFTETSPSGNTQSTELVFATLKTMSLLPTGFSLRNGEVFAKLSSSYIMDTGSPVIDGKFLGPTASEITADVTHTQTTPEITNTTGKLKANVAAIETLTPTDIGNDSYFKWGYWEATSVESNDSAVIVSTGKKYGAWIEPVAGVQITPNDVIGGYITNNIAATYTGQIFGTVYQATENTPSTGQYGSIQEINNGSISLYMNFGSSSQVSGNLSFDAGTAGSKHWAVDGITGSINGNSFILGGGSMGSGSNVPIHHVEGGGNFYSTDGSAIAGGIKISGDNGSLAVGAFKANTTSSDLAGP